MKPDRQHIISKIIAEQEIETQSQLLKALEERGIKSTQATLSRDLRDMRLVKELGPNGNYRYVESVRPGNDDHDQRLKKILGESVISYDLAQNLVVIKTLPGLASAACSAFDGMDIKGLVGTLAGDDTAFLALRDDAAAYELYHQMELII